MTYVLRDTKSQESAYKAVISGVSFMLALAGVMSNGDSKPDIINLPTTTEGSTHMLTEEQKAGVQEVINIIGAIKPLTIGDMKKAIAGLPDDTQIVVGCGDADVDFDWANLKLYSLPNEDEGVLALSFDIVNNFDARQF